MPQVCVFVCVFACVCVCVCVISQVETSPNRLANHETSLWAGRKPTFIPAHRGYTLVGSLHYTGPWRHQTGVVADNPNPVDGTDLRDVDLPRRQQHAVGLLQRWRSKRLYPLQCPGLFFCADNRTKQTPHPSHHASTHEAMASVQQQQQQSINVSRGDQRVHGPGARLYTFFKQARQEQRQRLNPSNSTDHHIRAQIISCPKVAPPIPCKPGLFLSFSHDTSVTRMRNQRRPYISRTTEYATPPAPLTGPILNSSMITSTARRMSVPKRVAR